MHDQEVQFRQTEQRRKPHKFFADSHRQLKLESETASKFVDSSDSSFAKTFNKLIESDRSLQSQYNKILKSKMSKHQSEYKEFVDRVLKKSNDLMKSFKSTPVQQQHRIIRYDEIVNFLEVKK